MSASRLDSPWRDDSLGLNGEHEWLAWVATALASRARVTVQEVVQARVRTDAVVMNGWETEGENDENASEVTKGNLFALGRDGLWENQLYFQFYVAWPNML